MSSASKTMFRTSRLLLIFTLVFLISIPNISFSEENEITKTPESLQVATTTVPATTSEMASTTATTTSPMLGGQTATGTGEVLGVSVPTEAKEAAEEEPVEEEPAVVELPELPAPQLPPLATREFKKRVKIDTHAFHSCEAETFRIDVTGKSGATARIMLQRDSDAPYEIEIGGLPQGIDITFAQGGGYQHTQSANERILTLTIRNEANSQKGDFSVPIFYTKKDLQDSSVVCQLNIVNL